MNFLKIIFFLGLILSVTVACNNDDVYICTQSDWVGNYMGIINCIGNVEDVIVTITASGEEDIIVEYEANSISSRFNPMTPNECSLNSTETVSGLTLVVEASLDGDNLVFKDTLSDTGGYSRACMVTAVRD